MYRPLITGVDTERLRSPLKRTMLARKLAENGETKAEV
jgi:hypothetical protein